MIRTALSRVFLLLCLMAMQNSAFADALDQPIDLPIRPGSGINPHALVFETYFGAATGFPVVTFRNGTWSFDPSDGRIVLYSSITGLQLSASDPIIPFSGSPRAVMTFFLDSSGNLVGGASGSDLFIQGTLDIDQDGTIDFSGIMLRAEVTSFTAIEGGMTDAFDITATITGGSLASIFGGNELRVSIIATDSSFNGDYTVPWKGTPNGKLYGANGGIDIEKSTNGVDADDPAAGDAPQIAPGDVVTWTYLVTNTGSTILENVTVTDDQGVTVTCPQTTLAPMESMECTASGIAENVDTTGFTTVLGLCGSIPNTPLYENMGMATGQTMDGQFVEDIDPSHYCNPDDPSIDIQKSTNGVDADDPNAGDAPQISVGGVVTWTYLVTNTGAVPLTNIVVTDDQGVAVTCPQTTLAPMANMLCTASGLAEDLFNTSFTTVPGLCGGFPNTPLYENMGHVSGLGPLGEFVEDVDPSHYCNPPAPAIDIEKATNGVDADDAAAGDAPQIAIGGIVTWTYVVTNTGNVALENVVVTDDQGVAVSCPQTTLGLGEMMTCTASGLADDLNNTGFTTVDGLCGSFPNTPLYENMGRATGTSINGDFVEDIDPSHYCNPPTGSIDIEKATNGVDADDANAGDAPQIAIGGVVSWTYVVTNTGSTTLQNIVVTDDQGVAVSCPQTTLAPGAFMTCTASGLADDLSTTAFTTVPGLCGGFPNTPMYENMGAVIGTTVTGEFVEDDDPSHYCNPPMPAIDIEKATNGVDADDPNAGDAPQIAPGSVVTWTYVVTNTGNVTLENVMVDDDQGVAVTCPQTTLTPGADMICTASGLADDLTSTGFVTVPGLCGVIPNTPLYENMGRATGTSVNGDFVEDIDASHYCNPPEPAIDVEKATNGVDADDPNAGDAPQIVAGGIVTWTYIVRNTGSVTLENVMVEDDQGVTVTCPLTTLTPGQAMVCSAIGFADDLTSTTFTTVPGLCGSVPNTPLYANMGHATGVSVTGEFVEDFDPSHYCNPPVPAIDIEKATNTVDADDPNAGDAPQIAIGGLVSWTYVVTNTGNVRIENIDVTDDQGAAVVCPFTVLDAGAAMTCTASGLADDLNDTTFTTVPGLCGSVPNTPMYENMGRVTGTAITGDFLEDIDPSHYCNPPAPAIDIEKATNGVDADDPNAGDAPTIAAGSVVSWTYVVTNTGNVVLNNVIVDDDQGVVVSCPLTTLNPGQMMTCSASGVAEDLTNTTATTVAGLCANIPNTPMYENMGRVTGESNAGDIVQDIDPSHYCNPPVPSIDIEKATNGVDADDPNAGDAPQIAVDGVVTWTYVVTNTGSVTLFNVTVTDDRGVAVTCPQDVLVPDEVVICTGNGTALDMSLASSNPVSGLCGGFPNSPLYNNVGDVVGTSAAGEMVDDADPSHYCNPPMPAINIEKATNGVDADDPNSGDAPPLNPGDPVTWTYLVTNTGDVTLSNVTVTDDQGVSVSCPTTTLIPGQVMTCTAVGTADDLGDTVFTTVPGLCANVPNTPLYENRGMVSGETVTGEIVEDEDLSHYCNTPTCDISVNKTCLIPMPPATDYECDKPIDSLTFIWDGAQSVRIKAYKGSVGSALLADIDDIQPGEEITVTGYAGSPNDVFFEVFNAGTSTKIGESKFHLSCSDDNMNGPEDCGLSQGNGKDNSSSLINNWLLEGIVDAGGTLDCTTDPGIGTNSCEFQAFPANCDTIDSVETITLVYTGGSCASSDNTQGSKFECSGGTPTASSPVTVTLFNGDSFTVQPGESFVSPRDGSGTEIILSNGGGTQVLNIHTSCSAPLNAGETFGSVTLAAINGAGIGTTVIYSYDITNNGPLALTALSAVDIPLGPLSGLPASLASGDTVSVSTSAFLTQTTTNTVVVDATDSAGASCSAVADATVTIVPPPPCDIDGEGVLELSSDKIKWELTNNGASTATISSLEISWPGANGDLIEVKFDGDKIYDTDRNGPSLTLGPNDWINDLNKRQIQPGDTDTLEIKFDNDVVGPASDYTITINFDEGCSVTFENTGLPFECTKPIDALSMIYAGGASEVRVKAYKGSVGAQLLLDSTVANGAEITVSGYSGSPNDVFWEVFTGGVKIGESKFHLSCSDSDMNGAEDCGKRQGNGKDNNGSLLNDWLLEGMVDADGPFDCSNLP